MVTTTFSGRQAIVAVDVDSGVAYTDADQVESISVNYDQELTEIYQLGDPDPQELKEGTISINGSITRKYETGNFSSAAVKFSEMTTTKPKPEFFMALFPEGDALPKILISNVKFGSYRTGIAIEDNAMFETLDWKGLAFAMSET